MPVNLDDPLPQLAKKLNHHHKLVKEAEITAIQNAWHAGDALQEAKKIVGHGGFMRWVKENFDGHHSKATRYMQVRSNYADPHNLPEVSVTAALKIISGSSDDESAWQPCGTMLGGDWLDILQTVEPFAEHDKTVPTFCKVLIEATETGVVAFATDRMKIGVAHADYEGSPFSVTLDLDKVHMLIGLAKSVVDSRSLREVQIGVGDAGFGCYFPLGDLAVGESQTVAVSETPLEIDFRERIQSAFTRDAQIVCYDANRLAQFTAGRGPVVMSALTNKAAVIQRGENFIGLLMPQMRPNHMVEWALPDWLAETDETTNETGADAAPEPKPWQNGYPLVELLRIEDRFADYNRFARGPYGEMTKPKIADALHYNRLHVNEWGVVESMITSRPTPMTTYLDVPLAERLRGDRVVTAFTYHHPDEMTAYLADFTEPTWVWIWQECDEQKRIVLDAEYTYVGGKITSHGEILGLYFWDPVDQRQHPQPDAWELIGLHRTPIRVDVTKAAHEIAALTEPFTDHYSNYNSGGSWSALSLRGYSPDPGFIVKPDEMGKKWKAEHADDVFALQDTALRSQLPAVDALAQALTDIAEPQRIRLMKLTAAGGELGRHTDLTDKQSGISDGCVARFHIPIITNDQVEFTSWGLDGERSNAHMGAGELWYLDVRKPHQAVNAGPDARVHLVIDVKANDAVRGLLR